MLFMHLQQKIDLHALTEVIANNCTLLCPWVCYLTCCSSSHYKSMPDIPDNAVGGGFVIIQPGD